MSAENLALALSVDHKKGGYDSNDRVDHMAKTEADLDGQENLQLELDDSGGQLNKVTHESERQLKHSGRQSRQPRRQSKDQPFRMNSNQIELKVLKKDTRADDLHNIKEENVDFSFDEDPHEMFEGGSDS